MHLMTVRVTNQRGCQQQTSPFRRADGVHRRDYGKEHIWYCLQCHIGGWQPSCSQEIKRKKITKGPREFETEVNFLGKIRHPNLLALRAYYLGPNGEKLLVFDYMPKGSLAAFLHGEFQQTNLNPKIQILSAMRLLL